MNIDIEETLARELREVADGLSIPPMPVLPQREVRRLGRVGGLGATRRWQAPLVAAAIVLIVAAGAVVAVGTRGGHEIAPAAPIVTGDAGLPTTAPTVPYVLDSRLYVAGKAVPGTWSSVQGVDAGWVAVRADGTWWSGGPGTDPRRIPQLATGTVPVVSPDGAYVAYIDDQDGQTSLTGYQTRSGGEGLGGTPVDLGDAQNGTAVTVRAVTDQGMVIAEGTGTDLLWLPETTQVDQTVDLSTTAPDQQVVGNTPAGLVVTDGETFDGSSYLADISASGTLTRTGSLPAHDDLIVSPGAAWLAFTPLGTTSGDVISVPTLQAQTLDGSRPIVLSAPTGWAFRTREWAWEDDDHLIAVVTGTTGAGTGAEERTSPDRMARCSAELDRCVLIAGH